MYTMAFVYTGILRMLHFCKTIHGTCTIRYRVKLIPSPSLQGSLWVYAVAFVYKGILKVLCFTKLFMVTEPRGLVKVVES